MALPGSSQRAASSVGMTSAGSRGWSPSAMSAAVVHRRAARRCRRAIERPAPPRAQDSRRAHREPGRGPRSSAACSGPVTTSTSRRPRGHARARRRGERSACPAARAGAWRCPIRRERPAASTMRRRSAPAPQKRRPAEAQIRGARGHGSSHRRLTSRRGRRLHRALGEDLQQVLLYSTEPCRSAWTSTPSAAFSAAAWIARRRPLAGDGGLDALGPHRLGARAGDADAGLGAPCRRPRVTTAATPTTAKREAGCGNFM